MQDSLYSRLTFRKAQPTDQRLLTQEIVRCDLPYIMYLRYYVHYYSTDKSTEIKHFVG